MVVCICHRVSDRDIERVVRLGCGDFDELQFELGVATSCGRCGDCARRTFERACAGAGASAAAHGRSALAPALRTLAAA